jgi:hypothetical protein
VLVHLQPKLYSPFKSVSIIALDIDGLGLELVGNTDLTTRRPYPNKNYAVACRKQGHKAVDGILIETDAPVHDFVCRVMWSVENQLLVSHRVHYEVIDSDFDAASADMTLWYSYLNEDGTLTPDRRPAWARERPPVHAEPLMEVIARASTRHGREDVVDELERGWIIRRSESFSMPTIERERITNPEFNERMPPVSAVFWANVQVRPKDRRCRHTSWSGPS